MKKILSALVICTCLSCIAGCSNEQTSTPTSSSSEQEITEYFSELSTMPKPRKSFGATFLKAKDEIYCYSLSSDAEDAKAAMQLYMAELMNEGFSLEKMDDSLYYMVYKDKKLVSLIGLAKEDDEFILAISFYD